MLGAVKSQANRLGKVGYEFVRVPPDLTQELYAAVPADSLRQKRLFNFGAGDFSHPYWTNIDYPSEWYASVQRNAFISYDAMSLCPLPIESDCAEAFYSSHVVGHLSNGR